jgi:hypothetical protein
MEYGSSALPLMLIKLDALAEGISDPRELYNLYLRRWRDIEKAMKKDRPASYGFSYKRKRKNEKLSALEELRMKYPRPEEEDLSDEADTDYSPTEDSDEAEEENVPESDSSGKKSEGKNPEQEL